MPNTYTLIGSTILTGNQTSIVFSAIPATYTDLVIRCSSRIDQAAAGTWIDLYFNTDTSGSSTNYSTSRFGGNGTSGFSGRLSDDDQAKLITATEGTSMTSNTFAATEIYIPSYTVSQNKPFSVFAVSETNAAAATIGETAGLWRNTATINQITLYPDNSTGNFVSGSSFYLYGIIKN